MKDQGKKTIFKVLLVLLAIAGVFALVWLIWLRPSEEPADIASFEECRAAGYPVQESFPEVCVTPDGQRFTNTQ